MQIIATADHPEAGPFPVSTPVTVDPSMAPPPPQHPPDAPPSPSSLASDGSSHFDHGFPGFRDYDDDQEPELVHDSSDISAQALLSVPAANSPKIPVSLPLDAPQWKEILIANLPHHDEDEGELDDFARAVENDARRVRHLEEVKRLREHNRLANISGQPLAPVPNVNGLKGPAGYNGPITSASQIKAMSAAELTAWLHHYGLSRPEDSGAEDRNRALLGIHLGIVSL